jgi:hypothetical protein
MYDIAGNLIDSNVTDIPVVHVSWNDAINYCKWLSLECRQPLPTAHRRRMGICCPGRQFVAVLPVQRQPYASGSGLVRRQFGRFASSGWPEKAQ